MIQAPLPPIPTESVRARIDEILARGEYGGHESAAAKWFSEMIEKIMRGIGRLFGISPGAAGSAIVVVAYVALALALVWIVWRIVRARLDAQAKHGEEPTLDPIAVRRARVADLRKSAKTARNSGDFLLALRLYFTALVVGLGEKGDLEYRDAWTNRELLERGEPSQKIERTLSPLVRDLDLRSFGGVTAVDADVAAMSRVVDDLLGAERA